jgi:hypothetical protein
MEVDICRASKELIREDYVGAEITQSKETWTDILGC